MREALTAPELRRGPIRMKPVVVLIIVLAGFLVGVPPAMVAAVGGAVLLITRTVEPRKVYDEVDWGLLVFFLGLFIIVGGAERAGLQTVCCGQSRPGISIACRSSWQSRLRCRTSSATSRP